MKKCKKCIIRSQMLSFGEDYVHPLTAVFLFAIMQQEEGVVGAERRGWINILREISGSALIDETLSCRRGLFNGLSCRSVTEVIFYGFG